MRGAKSRPGRSRSGGTNSIRATSASRLFESRISRSIVAWSKTGRRRGPRAKGRNPSRNFRGEQRRNDTHASRTGTAVESAVGDDGADPSRIADVLERVGVEQDEDRSSRPSSESSMASHSRRIASGTPSAHTKHLAKQQVARLGRERPVEEESHFLGRCRHPHEIVGLAGAET